MALPYQTRNDQVYWDEAWMFVHFYSMDWFHIHVLNIIQIIFNSVVWICTLPRKVDVKCWFCCGSRIWLVRIGLSSGFYGTIECHEIPYALNNVYWYLVLDIGYSTKGQKYNRTQKSGPSRLRQDKKSWPRLRRVRYDVLARNLCPVSDVLVRIFMSYCTSGPS